MTTYIKHAKQTRIRTLNEYILFEEQSNIRHEWINGKLIATPGTTDRHNKICLKLAFSFMQSLANTTCDVFMESVKLEISELKDYTYPDVFITCSDTDKNDNYVKRQPILIVEVLSNSTAYYDRVDKFLRYQKLKSLQYYLIVEPEKPVINLYYKQDNQWHSSTFVGLNDTVPLPELNITLPLSAIYA